MDNLRSINESDNAQKNFNSTAAIIALLAALAAGGIAWAAYNRSGEDLEDQAAQQAKETANDVKETTNNVTNNVSQGLQNMTEETREATMRATLETRLLAIQTRLMSDDLTAESRVELADEVKDLKADVDDTYNSASDAMKTKMAMLSDELENIEASIRANTGDALTMIQNLLTKVRTEVVMDEDENNQ